MRLWISPLPDLYNTGSFGTEFQDGNTRGPGKPNVLKSEHWRSVPQT